MRESAIPTLYLKELRSALRERSIVVNSVLLPVFLYPALLWVLFTAFTFVEGMAEGARSRVAVYALPAAHRELWDSLAAPAEIQLVEAPASVAEAEQRLAAGELDVVAEFGPATGAGASLPDNFTVRLAYDRSVERSVRARDRVSDVIERHRARWLERQAELRAIPPAEATGFRVAPHSVSTERQLGTVLLSEMLPLFLVVMVALGCFIPAIDSTAGERERSTWETTLTLAAPRRDVVVAKYLYVATLGITAGVLNVVAMFLSMGPVLAPLIARGGARFEFALAPLAFPVLVLGACALALFFAAAMMILAAFARTFKEGQGMVTPVYWLALIPLLLGQGSGVTLTPASAALPVANVALMMRDAVRGVFQWALIAETLAVSLAAVALCLLLARSVLRFEDFLLGTYEGSLLRFLRPDACGAPMITVAVDRLAKSFYDESRGEVRAVDGISFDCEAGRIFGLLGANGAGKTTTLRMLATILRPSAGSARVMEHDVVGEPEAVRRSLGFYSASTALYPRLTARETLEFFARVNGYPSERVAERVEELVARFGIADFQHARVEKLSSGMKQKVSIARTVVHDPPVLIFDEPTVGLDVINALEMQEVIRALRAEGKTIIFSTHIMSEAEKLCDTIAIVHRGCILASGSLEEHRAATGKHYLEDIFVHHVRDGG